MILGMDWLVRYGATIDCRKKMVTFEPEGEDLFVFVGVVHGPRIPIIFGHSIMFLRGIACI